MLPTEVLSFLYNILFCSTDCESRNKCAVAVMTACYLSSGVHIPLHLPLPDSSLPSNPSLTHSRSLPSSIKALCCSPSLRLTAQLRQQFWAWGGAGTEECANFNLSCFFNIYQSQQSTHQKHNLILQKICRGENVNTCRQQWLDGCVYPVHFSANCIYAYICSMITAFLWNDQPFTSQDQRLDHAAWLVESQQVSKSNGQKSWCPCLNPT